jgi:virulence-associated protein VapD
MFAITCLLDPTATEAKHPQGADGALSEICRTLRSFEFERQPNGIYTCDNEDLANLFVAMTALKALRWLPASVRDIRAFRVEQWSDFTSFFKQ